MYGISHIFLALLRTAYLIYTYPQMCCICADLQQLSYWVNKSLVVEVTHTLNFSIMSLDSVVQQLNKFVQLIIIIYSSGKQQNNFV